MHYEKNQYSEGFSICTLIIAGAFLYWGVDNFIENDIFMGCIWLAIGISILMGQVYALLNREKLRNIVLSEFNQYPDSTIDSISKNTGISKNDVKAIILDLKGSRQLFGTFSTTTGQMQLTSTSKTPMSNVKLNQIQSENQKRYCRGCGTEINNEENAKFCPHCGFEI